MATAVPLPSQEERCACGPRPWEQRQDHTAQKDLCEAEKAQGGPKWHLTGAGSKSDGTFQRITSGG